MVILIIGIILGILIYINITPKKQTNINNSIPTYPEQDSELPPAYENLTLRQKHAIIFIHMMIVSSDDSKPEKHLQNGLMLEIARDFKINFLDTKHYVENSEIGGVFYSLSYISDDAKYVLVCQIDRILSINGIPTKKEMNSLNIILNSIGISDERYYNTLEHQEKIINSFL